jgi:acyl-coenzyme A thioesterase PaaI-like protein
MMNNQSQQIESGTVANVSAPNSCFACSPDNPHGLHLQFKTVRPGETLAEWTPEVFTEGFHGIVHGGIVCTALDEAMSKAVSSSGLLAFTAEIRVRLHRHVSPHRAVQVHGWINNQSRRLIRTEASITDADGTELAHAWASFLTGK